MELESKTVFNFRDKTLALDRLRGTDFKYNKRVYLPNPVSTQKEALHEMRRNEMEKVFKKVVARTNKEKENRSDQREERKTNEKEDKEKKETLENALDREIIKRLKLINEIRKNKEPNKAGNDITDASGGAVVVVPRGLNLTIVVP